MSKSVLDQDEQHLVREAYCWNAELQNRHDQEFQSERLRPFHLLKPRLFPDGNKWCCLYGESLQEGVAGFGETPAKAAAAFDTAFYAEKASA